jgi:hypothetical protein
MKKRYIKPELEVFSYLPEEGYATTVALRNRTTDYVLVEGTDRGSFLTADEVSEYTGSDGEWTTGLWE